MRNLLAVVSVVAAMLGATGCGGRGPSRSAAAPGPLPLHAAASPAADLPTPEEAVARLGRPTAVIEAGDATIYHWRRPTPDPVEPMCQYPPPAGFYDTLVLTYAGGELVERAFIPAIMSAAGRGR